GIVVSFLMMISVSVIYIPTLFGYNTIHVTNSDMSPKIMKGSLCFVQPIEISTLEIGDAIGIKGNDGNEVIRRIVRIKPANGQILTKGDNLELLDISPLVAENLIGKSSFSLPIFGFLSSLLSTIVGKIIFGAIFVIILGASIFLLINNKNSNKDRTILTNSL
ncbi:MAG: signal peptidase I, partial [Oscillospiraceae bacterium]